MPSADAAPIEDRSRAWRELMLSDHGLLRLVYDNTHEIAPGVFRTYQPSPGGLARWKDRGATTIVNLRGQSPKGHYLLEREACARLGLRLVDLHCRSRAAPTKDMLRSARALFDEVQAPFVMHCKSGADRVGLMSTLYLFLQERRPLEEALRQLSFRYGHVRWGKTGVLRHFFETYRTARGDSPDAFYDWVDADYDPAAVDADFHATWWGTLLTERVLRRE